MAARAITSHDINALAGRTYPGLESGIASLLAPLRRFAAWYERDRRYRATVAELSRLSDHLLADIGIDRTQIHALARGLSRRAA